jgi:hypothetical protein
MQKVEENARQVWHFWYTIKIPEAVLAKAEHWAMAQEDQPPRSQAIRRLVEIGLRAKVK